MKRAVFVSLALSTLVGCSEPPPEGGEQHPIRDPEWRVEADLPFPYGSKEEPGITKITIGGLLSNDNFENRGDVIVNFTGPPDRITVEIRRFTMAASDAAAAEQFSALALWAYDTGGDSPSKPSDMMDENNCLLNAWKDQCHLRVYYDGLTQLSRLGADLRVTLPENYRHEVVIETNDADDDDDYVNRGNICLENVNASVTVSQMHSGIALASLSPSIAPSPHCPDSALQACIDAGWTTGCGDGTVSCDTFGRLDISTDSSGTADITVDVPSTLWAYINAENTGAMQNIDEEFCNANVTVPGVVYTMPLDPAKPWQARAGEINDPGMQAVAGAGYSINVESAECGAAARTENPEDFVGKDNGDEQKTGERGNLAVCTDCLRGRNMCDRLDELAQNGGAPPVGL